MKKVKLVSTFFQSREIIGVSDFYAMFTLKQQPEILARAKDQSCGIQSPDGDTPLLEKTLIEKKPFAIADDIVQAI